MFKGPNRKLYQAVKQGQLAEAQQLFDNYPQFKWSTRIITAVGYHGSIELFKALVTTWWKSNGPYVEFWNIVKYIARHGNSKMLEAIRNLLLDFKNGDDVFFAAVEGGKLDNVQWIIDNTQWVTYTWVQQAGLIRAFINNRSKIFNFLWKQEGFAENFGEEEWILMIESDETDMADKWRMLALVLNRYDYSVELLPNKIRRLLMNDLELAKVLPARCIEYEILNS